MWSGKELNIPLPHQRVAVNKERWPHLHDVPFPEVEWQKISLIIGTNVPEVFVPLEVCHGSPNDPIAIHSCIGFAVLVRTGERVTQQRHNVHHIHTSTNDVSLHQQVELFWESESLGTTKPYKSMSVEDRYAERIINRMMLESIDHYCMGLLWKHDPPDFPFNCTMAEIRLRHLKRRLTCMRSTIQLSMVTLPKAMLVSSLKNKLIKEVTRPGTFPTILLTARQTGDDNEDKYGSEVAEAVRRNFYVDDLLKSIQTTDQAIMLAFNLIAMLKEGSFLLTKFLINRREVLPALPSQERANPTLNLELDRLPINRTLGLHWDAERDIFCFKTVSTTKPATKRGSLSTISSLFDPLGFLSPSVLPVKVLIQDLWKEKIGWDEEIQYHHLKVWQRWTHSLPQLEGI